MVSEPFRVYPSEGGKFRKARGGGRESGVWEGGRVVQSSLFSICEFTWRVWCLCFEWLGVSFVIHKDPLVNFQQFRLCSASDVVNDVCGAIWVGVVSGIWRHRNSVTFDRGVVDALKVFARVQDPLVNFQQFRLCSASDVVNDVCGAIWVGVVSGIWRHRNSVTFDRGVVDALKVFARVQLEGVP
nr:hypothetical protein [Phaseolus vulgaris]